MAHHKRIGGTVRNRHDRPTATSFREARWSGPGTYLDDIVLSAQGSTTTIKVYLVVENLQNVAFNFSYSIGGPAPTQQTAGIFTSGCGVRVANMALGYTSDQSWLTAVLNASGGGFSVEKRDLTATPAGLSAGSSRGCGSDGRFRRCILAGLRSHSCCTFENLHGNSTVGVA